MRHPPATAADADDEVIKHSWSEPERFGGIFDRHATTIHRYLARRIGPLVADDLTAETFLVAFRGREHYDVNQTDALPWLYGIAANLLRRERRSEIRQYRALARTRIDPALDGDADRVAARVSAQARVRKLATVLARLSVREREVLTLVAQAELSYAEVARALDIPIGTVRSRLHSARSRVRKALRDCPEIDLTNGIHDE